MTEQVPRQQPMMVHDRFSPGVFSPRGFSLLCSKSSQVKSIKSLFLFKVANFAPLVENQDHQANNLTVVGPVSVRLCTTVRYILLPQGPY